MRHRCSGLHLRVHHQRSGYRYPLLLTAGQRASTLPHRCVVALQVAQISRSGLTLVLCAANCCHGHVS